MEKYRRIVSLVVFFSAYFICFSCYAQYTKADSLRVFSLIENAEVFFGKSNYDSALFYCAKAEILSRQKNFKKGQAYAQIEATDIYIDKDELAKADAAAALVNKVGLQIKDSLITAVTWMQMAQVKMYSDKFDDAIPLFEKSLQYYLANHPTKFSALAYNDLGYTWGRKGELSKQADYLIKSVSIYENYFPDKYGDIAIALNNLSSLYYSIDQRPKAIEYAKKALVYREKDGDLSKLSLSCCNLSQIYIGIDNEQAEKYLKLCEKYAEQSSHQDRLIHSYVTASYLYTVTKKTQAAFDYELKAISLLEKGNNMTMLARRYISAATLCRVMKKDTTITKTYFNKALNILQLSNDKLTLRDFYINLANYYSENKNYGEALTDYKKYILYKDSIVSENTQSSIAEIGTRYETEKKDNEISQLNISQKIRQLEIEKQKAIIAGNVSEAKQKQSKIILLSQQKELQDAKIKQQTEDLEKQLLVLQNNKQQLKLSRQEQQLNEKELRAQKQVRNFIILAVLGMLLIAGFIFNRYKLKKKLEQQKGLLTMRNNISQDLHDDIGASLSSINILNELAKRNITHPEKSKEYLSKASEDIQHISESLSDIVWNINPKYDDAESIFIRMKRYAADMFDGKNINGTFDLPVYTAALNMTMTQRRDLYLIFKEAVNNLVKYSAAKNALVKIETDGKKICMWVGDDGNGFDENTIKPGNGLYNMKQRAAAAGAEISINSIPGKGTEIYLKMNGD